MKRGTPMKRTAFKREGPGLQRDPKPKADQAIKPKVCTAPKCGREFTPLRPLQSVCGPICAKRKVVADAQAKIAAHRQRREAIKTIPKLIAEADKAFAAYIRERDRLAGLPCISSGKPLDWSGNKVDAGHYRSRGAASHLRYHEDNCHAQTKQDNQWKAGNVVEYRIRLVLRIGIARVEALEGDNTVHHWTREELIAIRNTYRRKARELAKAREQGEKA